MQFVNGEAILFLKGLREHVSPLDNFGENPLPLLIPHQGVILEEFSVAVQFGSR